MCLGMTVSAQSGIIESRKANDASGKVLTMEETILSRELSPESINAQWSGAGELVMMKDGKWQVMDLKDGSFYDYKGVQSFPVAYTEGQSLYLRTEDGKVTPIAESENSQITYGQFVSRNEFGINGGIFWAPDKSKVAF